MADKLDVKKTTYQMWELGKHQPTYGMLVKIAELGHVSTDWILGTKYTEPGDREIMEYLSSYGITRKDDLECVFKLISCLLENRER